MEPLIVTAALTGAVTVPTQTPYLPYTIEQLAEDAEQCARAGAAIIHIHARNPENGARRQIWTSSASSSRRSRPVPTR